MSRFTNPMRFGGCQSKTRFSWTWLILKYTFGNLLKPPLRYFLGLVGYRHETPSVGVETIAANVLSKYGESGRTVVCQWSVADIYKFSVWWLFP